MTREQKHKLFLVNRLTNYEEKEFIFKDAILDWLQRQMSSEQGFEDRETERGYKRALNDVVDYINNIGEE